MFIIVSHAKKNFNPMGKDDRLWPMSKKESYETAGNDKNGDDNIWKMEG